MTDDYLYYDLPMFAITNYFHGGASCRLKYGDEFVCGLWYVRYSFEGNSQALLPRSSLYDYGWRFIRRLEAGEKDFAFLLFEKSMAISKLADKLQEMNFREVALGEIPDKASFYDEYAVLFPWVIGVCYVLDFAFEEYAAQNHIDLSEIEIPGESFIRREERELKGISLMNDVQERQAALKEHAARYSFLWSDYKGYHPVAEEYFSSRLESVKVKDFPQALPVKEPHSLAEWMGFLVRTRDERKRCNMLFNALFTRYLKRDCEKHGFVYEQAVMLSPDEYEQQKLKRKLDDYAGVRFLQTSREHGFSDIPVEKWERLLAQVFEKKTIGGVVVSKGKASGRVSVVLQKSDFSKVQDGDIIVASMTRPDYSPILSKAAGIVTNEGSITCHAAIISRELGIPCIIGTNIATKVLKDGDLVEVDAINGVVRKVKQ